MAQFPARLVDSKTEKQYRFSETKQVAYDIVKSLALATLFPHVPHLALD